MSFKLPLDCVRACKSSDCCEQNTGIVRLSGVFRWATSNETLKVMLSNQCKIRSNQITLLPDIRPATAVEDEGVQSSKAATEGNGEPKEVLDRELRLRMVSKLLDIRDPTRRSVHTKIEEKLVNQKESRVPIRAVRIKEHLDPANGMIVQIPTSSSL